MKNQDKRPFLKQFCSLLRILADFETFQNNTP